MVERSTGRYEMNYNWAKGYYYFSLGEYYNPRKMGVGRIRAVNEYELKPQEQFNEANKHSQFDIVRLVLDGQLRCNSSVKDRVLIEKNECHLIRAGTTPVQHSIQNCLADQSSKYIEFWIDNAGKYNEEQGQQETFKLTQDTKGVQNILNNNNFSLDIVQLSKDSEEFVVANETLSQCFILVVNGNVTCNGNIALQDRDAITQILPSYKFTVNSTATATDAINQSVSLLILKQF